MKQSEAAKVVGMLQAAFPAARMTEATVVLYERLLVDLDFELASATIERLICTTKFCPTVSEIRDAAADIALGPSRSGVEAWGDVGQAIRRVGSYGMPKFEDPLVAECVRMMGWRNLCLGEAPEHTDRARFCELYQDLQRKQRLADVSEPGRLLPGHQEARQLPPNVRQLVQDVGKPLQSNHGRTGVEKTRRL
jgi:hypothetical protein